MRRSIRLPLYGEIDHGPSDDLSWDLYQTEALARLRDISLSSLPTRFAPHGSAASRFSHSVGVGYLARLLVDNNPDLEPWRERLISAALCHDIGSPPFSHISEIFMFQDLGQTHEERTGALLAAGGEIATLLEYYQVNAEEVLELILGQGSYGRLIAGSIDLDNIDNSLHLLTSIEAGGGRSYDPRRLIKAFVIDGEKIALNSDYADQLIGWDSVRRRLYDLLQREEQLSSSTMLYRALEFACDEGAIGQDFWSFEEGRALAYLRYQSGERAGYILDQLNRWRQYHLTFSLENSEEDLRLSALYDDWRQRYRIANYIAGELGVKEEDIALYIGRDKGAKQIDLPFVGPRAEQLSALFAGQQGRQKLNIYINKEHLDLCGGLGEIVEDIISDLPAGSPGHAFF